MKIIYLTLLMIASIHVSAAPPTTAASNLSFNTIDGGYFNIGWTAGNGTRRILVCKAGSAVTFKPQNGVDYTSSDVFGSGQEVATGEFVIYDNAFTSFFVTGLTASTHYYFAMFEYNGSGTTTEYLTSTFLAGDASTSSAPTVQVSKAIFSAVTANSFTVNWTNGNGLRRMITMREGSAVNADPVNNVSYFSNSNFGTGDQIGTGNYAVYKSSDASTTIRNLKPGVQYYLAFYEFNGSSQPQYILPAYTATVTTRSMPTVASSNVTITKTDGKALTLNWTNGNGQRRIVVAKKGSDVTALPVDDNTYSANSVFGSGTQLAAGEYVVFDDNFNIASITGLDAASTYYFKIFEYDGGATNASYLTTSFGAINGPTASKPTVQGSNITATNITSTTIPLSMAAGNGRARIIVGRKNAAVNFSPVDFTAYTGNNDFGSGQDLGNGNFVVSNATGSGAFINKLEANTTYHFAVFEFNGFDQPLYLLPGAVFSAKTLGVLPVKLSKWEAMADNKKVRLQWTTSTEINSKYFLVQRSSDGVNFIDIASVPAAGYSQSPVDYNTEDNSPLPRRSFYRLKMIDKDGSAEYSSILSVTAGAHKPIAILQNPVQQVLEFSAPNSATGNNSQWQIVNVSGQVIKKGVINSTRISVDVALLPAGNYWLMVNLNNKQQQNLPFYRQ